MERLSCLDLAEPLHHHVDTQREAECLDDILKVKQGDIADNTPCRQQVGALDGLKIQKPLLQVLENIHGETRVD